MVIAGKNGAAPVASQSGMSSANVDSMLVQIAGRIDGLLSEEASALSSHAADIIDQLITRKNHLALEVSRLERHIGSHVPSPEVKLKLADTLKNLSRNAAQIQRHIEAVDEVVEMLVDIHRKHASDGTYTADGALGDKLK
jgi:hypothetical protein